MSVVESTILVDKSRPVVASSLGWIRLLCKRYRIPERVVSVDLLGASGGVQPFRLWIMIVLGWPMIPWTLAGRILLY